MVNRFPSKEYILMVALRTSVYGILIIFYIIGLECPSKIQRHLYLVYKLIIFAVLIYIFYLSAETVLMKRKFNVDDLLFTLTYSVIVAGTIIFYLDAILNPVNLEQVFLDFSDIDRLLEETFCKTIKDKLVPWMPVILIAIILINIGLVAILFRHKLIFYSLNLIFLIPTLVLFVFICRQVNLRYKALKNCISRGNIVGEEFGKNFDAIQLIFCKISSILSICNKYFRAKLLFVLCKFWEQVKLPNLNIRKFSARAFIAILTILFKVFVTLSTEHITSSFSWDSNRKCIYLSSDHWECPSRILDFKSSLFSSFECSVVKKPNGNCFIFQFDFQDSYSSSRYYFW